jgi:hypothetical protein
MRLTGLCVIVAVLADCAVSLRASAQEKPEEPLEEGASALELSKKTENPVSDLITIPLQNNFNFGVGPEDRTQYILNIQPVIPVALSNRWLLVTRTILPVMDQPVGPDDRQAGLGDLILSLFLSPRDAGPVTVAVGPALQAPTATSGALGAGKWALGPTAAVLTMPGRWVIGALVRNVWSFAGNSEREGVNEFFLQPVLSYNLPRGWAVTAAPEIEANWKQSGDNVWTIPVGGTVSKVMKNGGSDFRVSLGGFWNVVHPDEGPTATIRATVALLLPR